MFVTIIACLVRLVLTEQEQSAARRQGQAWWFNHGHPRMSQARAEAMFLVMACYDKALTAAGQ